MMRPGGERRDPEGQDTRTPASARDAAADRRHAGERGALAVEASQEDLGLREARRDRLRGWAASGPPHTTLGGPAPTAEDLSRAPGTPRTLASWYLLLKRRFDGLDGEVRRGFRDYTRALLDVSRRLQRIEAKLNDLRGGRPDRG